MTAANLREQRERREAGVKNGPCAKCGRTVFFKPNRLVGDRYFCEGCVPKGKRLEREGRIPKAETVARWAAEDVEREASTEA